MYKGMNGTRIHMYLARVILEALDGQGVATILDQLNLCLK